jgi:predicted component of viral defense system (DUF524 family)
LEGTQEVKVAIVDKDGRSSGFVEVKLLPSTDVSAYPPPLIDLRGSVEHDLSLEPVQLLEGEEYLFEISLDTTHTGIITTNKREVFNPDTEKGERGRLRTGLYTGFLSVTISTGGAEIGSLAFEVRSRKMDYLSHYRWMLNDIAEKFSEVVMERFAPTEQRFKIDDTQEAKTLYQRFAFLKSLIDGESFTAAIQEILTRPHRAWIDLEEFRRPGQGIAVTSLVSRQLGKSGPRTILKEGVIPLEFHSLPSNLQVIRREETIDTPENRFIKFALEVWRAVIGDIGRILEGKKQSVKKERGLIEIKALEDRIDALLAEELFREVGQLVQFPAGSQVLQKREGYRDLFRTYIQFEAAAVLAWGGGEDVYSAGQRDVATLYEYWVFLQLAKIISGLCQEAFDWGKLLDVYEGGLEIRLRREGQKVLSGVVDRLGRRLQLELWFKRTFGSSKESPLSWTRPMIPDCSLLIAPHEDCPAHFEEVWVHFDAKYRVENLDNLFGKKDSVELDEATPLDNEVSLRTQAKRDDLLKMHAYRDAIHRSAGAYIIYPGNQDQKYPQYHEILPGLGAFALRPTESGEAEGVFSITVFINDVLNHVASQITQHERWRYWTEEVYCRGKHVESFSPAASFLSRPPADTIVLLGFVKNQEHLEWIHKNKRYNLRADEREGRVGLLSQELAAEILLLHGPAMEKIELWSITGEPELVTRDRMIEMGYPDPRGQVYFCLRLQEIAYLAKSISVKKEKAEAVRARVAPNAPYGAPIATTWLELVG